MKLTTRNGLGLVCLVAASLSMTLEASVFPSSSSSSRSTSLGCFGGRRRHQSRSGLSSSFSSLSSSSSHMAEERRQLASSIRRRNTHGAAMAIPGYGLGEQIFVGGFQNFLQIYNLVITGRILLSWFPAAQGIGVLQPIFAITDPYLNLFRGLIPPIFGLDLSPLLAFFLLNTLGTATTALGADVPSTGVNNKLSSQSSTYQQRFLSSKYAPFPVKYMARKVQNKNSVDQGDLCLNY